MIFSEIVINYLFCKCSRKPCCFYQGCVSEKLLNRYCILNSWPNLKINQLPTPDELVFVLLNSFQFFQMGRLLRSWFLKGEKQKGPSKVSMIL